MVKTEELSEDRRQMIIDLHKSGNGYKKIQKKLRVPISTIKSIIKKFKATGTVANLPRKGRKSSLPPVAVAQVVQEVNAYPRVTVEELQNKLASLGHKVSTATVRRYLRKNGVYHCASRRKLVHSTVKVPVMETDACNGHMIEGCQSEVSICKQRDTSSEVNSVPCKTEDETPHESFADAYAKYHIESLQNMTKQKLVEEYLELERCMARLEEENIRLRHVVECMGIDPNGPLSVSDSKWHVHQETASTI